MPCTRAASGLDWFAVVVSNVLRGSRALGGVNEFAHLSIEPMTWNTAGRESHLETPHKAAGQRLLIHTSPRGRLRVQCGRSCLTGDGWNEWGLAAKDCRFEGTTQAKSGRGERSNFEITTGFRTALPLCGECHALYMQEGHFSNPKYAYLR